MMADKILKTKTGLAFLACLFLSFMLWVSFNRFVTQDAEQAITCDAGAYVVMEKLPLYIVPEYMQSVYVTGLRDPAARSHNGYTCRDVTEEKPLPVETLRFFPEAFLNKNILIEETPFKTILPVKVHRLFADMGDKQSGFSCNDNGQCVALVIRGDVFFMLEMSDIYFASSLQKDIFYASFQRFIEDMIVKDVKSIPE